MVLAIFNATTWRQQINLRIDSGGLGIGIDARTSCGAFAASFLSAVKATSEIYPILHGDIVDGGSICKCVCIVQLQDYDTPPAFLTLLDQSTESSNSRIEKLQQRLLRGHQAPKDSDFIAAITPTPSSLARYHSAASPEASAALLAVPKTQQITFPKQAYRVFLRRRLSASASKAGSALSLMTPWPFVPAIWQKRPACMQSSRIWTRGRHREWNETRSSLRRNP